MNVFDLWSNQKKKLDTEKIRGFFHVREIWFAQLGKNVGDEQDGKENFLRPVLVLKKFNNQVF